MTCGCDLWRLQLISRHPQSTALPATDVQYNRLPQPAELRAVQYNRLHQPAELRAPNGTKLRHRRNVHIAEEGDSRKRLKNLRINQRPLDAVNHPKMLKLCTEGPCWASKTLAMGDSRSEQRLWHVQCAASLLRSWKTSSDQYIFESDPCTHGQLYVALSRVGGWERVRAMHQSVGIKKMVLKHLLACVIDKASARRL